MICPLRLGQNSQTWVERNISDFECVRGKCAWFVVNPPMSLSEAGGPQTGSCAVPSMVDGMGVQMTEVD